MKTGIITKVAGPLVIAEGMRDANMFDVVRVSEQRLIGEIIEMHGDRASIRFMRRPPDSDRVKPLSPQALPFPLSSVPDLSALFTTVFSALLTRL